MSEQQSQQGGISADEKKAERARVGYEPIAVSQAIVGALGEHQSNKESDPALALSKGNQKPKEKID